MLGRCPGTGPGNVVPREDLPAAGRPVNGSPADPGAADQDPVDQDLTERAGAGPSDADGQPAPGAGPGPAAARQRFVRRSSRSGYPLAREGHIEYDRVVFFSDAVFAIAITLLIVDLKVGKGHSGHELLESHSRILGFVLSFAVIGIFWLAHHTIFRYVEAFDRPLIVLNLLFLGTIAFLPYPTQLLFSTSTKEIPAVVFYASCAAAAGLAEAAVWLQATRPAGGLAPRVGPHFRRNFLLRILPAPAVFLLSIPLAFAAPDATPAVYSWALIFITGRIIDWFFPIGEDLLKAAG
jgi:uncharacterized membrane protein